MSSAATNASSGGEDVGEYIIHHLVNAYDAWHPLAGLGIGQIAGAAMTGIARQPEASNKIQTAMIIGAALIEGVAFFSAVLCLMALNK